jgi:CHASE2 domain-containing sensor protein
MKNIVLGLFITLLLISLRHGQWVTELENSSIDWIMKFYRGNLVKDNTPPFVILDIDDNSYRS